MFTTLGAPERRRLRGRRGAIVREAGPEPVPTSRVTVVAPEPFADRPGAEEWLEQLRAGTREPRGEVDAAVAVVNRALQAHRVARADPRVGEVSAEQALVVRLGFGAGDAVAEGRYGEAWELPRRRGGVRRSMEAPEERFAALLGAREQVLACEELVLRARADLDARRPREAALQARVALESLLSELGGELGDDRRPALEADRRAVGEAANAALHGSPPQELDEAVRGAIGRMEAALRARRLAGA